MTEILVTSSVLILVIVLLRRLLRGRIAPCLQYGLWLLVVLRLLIPGSLFPAPVSAAGLASALLPRPAAVQPLPPQSGGAAQDAGGQSALADMVDRSGLLQGLTGQYTVEKDFPIGTSYDQWWEERPGEEYTINGWQVDLEAGVQTVRYSQYASLWDMPFWRWPWYAGMAVTAAALFLANAAFYVRLRRGRRRLAAEELPIPCRTPVYAAEDLDSPCLFGIFRPAIYVNQAALDPERLEHILVHEQTHLRHLDHLWALLRGLCLTVYWFDPLVWWAAVLSRRDCELACDAGAIRRLGEDRRLDYGKTLVSMVTPRTSPADLLRASTTMTAGKRTMTERVRLIAKRPRMLKLTLAALVLAVCGAVLFTFGGSGGNAPQPSPQPSQDGGDAEPPSVSDAAKALDEAGALELYAAAREAWSWFDLGTLPTTGDSRGSYRRVDGFDSLEELRSYLRTLFSPELTEHLLTGYQRFQELDGQLYAEEAGRGSSIYAGGETVAAFLMDNENAAQYGYDCHIFAQTEVLDEDLSTVLYQKRHDWFIAWDGENYVFTSFGPWDDADPQPYYNALAILDHCEQGDGALTWLPLLRDMDWSALSATRDRWPEGFDLADWVLSAVYDLIRDQGEDLTAAQYADVLSASEGLDGAYAEGFSSLVWGLYAQDPQQFAQVVLEDLTADQRGEAAMFLGGELAYRMGREEPLPAREVLDRLEQTLAGEPVPVVPSEVWRYLLSPGESFRLLPVGVQGVYAAAYASGDPDVAAVDAYTGAVTAASPGTAEISLHVECSAGQFDFTCTVVCQWEE